MSNRLLRRLQTSQATIRVGIEGGFYKRISNTSMSNSVLATYLNNEPLCWFSSIEQRREQLPKLLKDFKRGGNGKRQFLDEWLRNSEAMDLDFCVAGESRQ